MDYKKLSQELALLTSKVRRLNHIMEKPPATSYEETEIEKQLKENLHEAMERITNMQQSADERHRAATSDYANVMKKVRGEGKY